MVAPSSSSSASVDPSMTSWRLNGTEVRESGMVSSFSDPDPAGIDLEEVGAQQRRDLHRRPRGAAEPDVPVDREVDPHLVPVEVDAADLAGADAGDLHLFSDPKAGAVLDDRRDVALAERDEADGGDDQAHHRRRDDAGHADRARAEPLEEAHRHAAE